MYLVRSVTEFFHVSAEVAVQHKSANFAIPIDGDKLLTDKHLGECTSSDQLLNFFTLVAEVAVQHKSANFAIPIDGDKLLTDKHLGELLGANSPRPPQQLIGRRGSIRPKFSN